MKMAMQCLRYKMSKIIQYMILILMKKLGRERVDKIEKNQLFKNITSDAVPTKAQA